MEIPQNNDEAEELSSSEASTVEPEAASSIITLPPAFELKTQAKARLAAHAAGHSVADIADADMQNLGKRARKRLERIERQKERKQEKKAQKREERQRQLEENPASAHPRSRAEEDPEVAKVNRERNAQRKAEAQKLMLADAAAGPTVVIDMSEKWELAMTVQERLSLAQQCKKTYSNNKRCLRPARLLVTGLPAGGIVDRALHKLGNVDGWLAFQLSNKPLEEHLPTLRATSSGLPPTSEESQLTPLTPVVGVAATEASASAPALSGRDSSVAAASLSQEVPPIQQQDNDGDDDAPRTTSKPPVCEVVYLTADTDEELDEVAWDGSVVYVLGAIVDRNRLTKATALKAQQLKVRAVKLPIERFCPSMSGTKVLTVNHCVELLLRRGNGESWGDAFARTMPERKDAKVVTGAKGKQQQAGLSTEDNAAADDDGDGSETEGFVKSCSSGGADSAPAEAKEVCLEKDEKNMERDTTLVSEVSREAVGSAMRGEGGDGGSGGDGALGNNDKNKKRPAPDTTREEAAMAGRRKRAFSNEEDADPTFRRDMRHLCQRKKKRL